MRFPIIKHFILLILTIVFQHLYAQNNSDNLWRQVASDKIINSKGKKTVAPENAPLFQLNFQLLQNRLKNVSFDRAIDKRFSITVPTTEGYQTYKIFNSNILEKELQASGADIQTFAGYNANKPNEHIRISCTNSGFHAMILSENDGVVYLEPYQRNDVENYVLFKKKDIIINKSFKCLVENAIKNPSKTENDKTGLSIADVDCSLRTYRMAIACTGEYTFTAGPTKALAQGHIATIINNISAVFERDVGANFSLISNANLIYLDSLTDPFDNQTIGGIGGNLGATLDAELGNAGYDIGHGLGAERPGSETGGTALRGGVCVSADKSLGSTIWDPFDGQAYEMEILGHEIGHQMGSEHTFNAGLPAGFAGGCQVGYSPGYGQEPGSGTSIMAYGGLCDQSNVVPFIGTADVMLSFSSIEQILKELMTDDAGTCVVPVATGNNKPVVDAGPIDGYYIPVNTPFELTANAIDADAGDVLTYSWEPYDMHLTAQDWPVANSTVSQPNFRLYEPTTNNTRYFPNMDSIVANVMWPKYEMIPSVSRDMKFKVVVRDNSPLGPCIDHDDIDIHFDGTKGPFLVTNPNTTGIVWTSNTTETVTWDVAGTINAPVSCANVNILLSTDGGLTYPHTLAVNVPNDGTHPITAPNIGTTTARIKIVCSDNIFFDISNNNFTITASANAPPFINFKTLSLSTYEKAIPNGNLDCRPYKDYTIIMQISNAPTGTANVAINIGGNATNNFDYQIIGSPITFPNGSTADRSFTVRIIDDGVVDPLENLELTYTITGTTNATAGTTNNTCLVKIYDDEDDAFVGPTPFYVEDFDGGSFIGTPSFPPVPLAPGEWEAVNNLDPWWMIGNGGLISGAGNSLYLTNDNVVNGYNDDNFLRIWSPMIDATGRSDLYLSFDYIGEGELQKDYATLGFRISGAMSLPISDGGNQGPYVGKTTKQTRTLKLPEALDGQQFQLVWSWFSDNNGAGNGASGLEIDNIKITEGGSPGDIIETNLTPTFKDEQYLGPFQTIYFRNQHDKDLMVKIENTSNHDYGCTTVEVNRAGIGAIQFQSTNTLYDVTEKTFRVIPTNNNPSGTYKMTLFYTEKEIVGWEAATGNTRANLDMVKTIGNISTVTPGAPQIPTTFYENAILGAFGNDVTITSTYNNGFSGFAAGQSEIPLPINLLNFNATLINNQLVNLNWATASEINNDFFTIERSKNTIDWEILTTMNGAGNSSIVLNYNTIDDSPLERTSYYRLKQTDFNGMFEYSQIRSININTLDNSELEIFPNPTENRITVIGSKNELEQVKIYTILGQDITLRVKKTTINTSELVIDLSNLTTGIYYVRTKTTATKIYKK